jgi:hypothetical protein
MGAIMCRVVTCTPPWQLDSTCTGTPATDQSTLTHDRPCLHQPVGSLDTVAATGLATARVTGWAADQEIPDQSIDVHIYRDGTFVTAANANKSRPDVANAFPGFGAAHGFDVTIPINSASQSVCAYAINRGSPEANPLLGCRPLSRVPFGNFDSVRVRRGGFVVQGWAIDPDAKTPVNVQVVVDGVVVATARADAARPDVAAAYPDYGPAHGFVVDVSASSGNHQVCINAIDLGDSRRVGNLGCRTAMVGGSPIGNFETLRHLPGGARLTGWAIDPDTADPVSVLAYVDGRLAGTFKANVDRPDVGNAFPEYGSQHGFVADVTFGAGSHNVCVAAANVATGSNVLLGCRAASGQPFGNFDAVTPSGNGFRLTGWAIDPDSANPINVHVYVDRAFRGSFVANADRPDVAAAYPGYGSAHGYVIDIDAAPGSHQICVYAIDPPGQGFNPLLGCRTASR